MSQDFTMYVGTVGGGLSVSADGGETFQHLGMRGTLPPSECDVRAVTVYPDNPDRVLAGTNAGVYRSENRGQSWELLDSQMNTEWPARSHRMSDQWPLQNVEIWSVTVDPVDTQTIFVGARPGVFRSKDDGRTWDELPLNVRMDGPIGTPRTTILLVDPRDHRTIWAGTEVDAVYRSTNGGDSWTRMPEVGPQRMAGDIHGLAIKPGDPATTFCTTPHGFSTSTDDGSSWDLHEFPKFHEPDWKPGDGSAYCRTIFVKPDNPDVMLVGTGNTIPGDTGAIRRSCDGGKTWEAPKLPVTPNSVLYGFGSHAVIPDTIVAHTVNGYLYLSEDGGESWGKLSKEFGHIRAVAVSPN